MQDRIRIGSQHGAGAWSAALWRFQIFGVKKIKNENLQRRSDAKSKRRSRSKLENLSPRESLKKRVWRAVLGVLGFALFSHWRASKSYIGVSRLFVTKRSWTPSPRLCASHALGIGHLVDISRPTDRRDVIRPLSVGLLPALGVDCGVLSHSR